MSEYRRLRPVWTVDQPEMDEVVSYLGSVTRRFPGRVLLAEMGLPPARAARNHGAIDIPLNFGLITSPWAAERLERRIRAYLDALPDGAWPNWVLGNHDVARVATRLGDELARAAAVVATTLPGAVTLYYGDELGLPDHPTPPDPPADGAARAEATSSRDPQRAPMPWNTSPAAGFSTGTPWLPPYPDAAERSVASQTDDPASALTLYRKLLALRRERLASATAPLSGLRADNGTLHYERGGAPRHAIVARLDDTPARAHLPDSCRVILSSRTTDRAQAVAGAIDLAPHEAVIVELE